MKVNHTERKHAKLSASSSAKWLNCPGSINAEKGYKNESSIYANEGTLAHELADLCLKTGNNTDFYIGKTVDETDALIDAEMAIYVQEYVDYVLSHETSNSCLFTEEKVSFDNVVPDGFGTMDAAIIDDNTSVCHVFDLKYGRGVKVSAIENTQAQLYAIGMLNELGFLDAIKSFRLHIVQPRINNIEYWDITCTDLIKFGEFVKERATLALSDNAKRVPGHKQCQWCRAKSDCKVLYNFTKEIVSSDFENLEDIDINVLNDNDKKNILDNKSLVELFFKSIESNVFETLISGKKFKGYKIVKGRSIRKWTDEAEPFLFKKLKSKAFEKKLIGITKAKTVLSKEDIEKLTYKPEGKLTLANEKDKRKAVEASNNLFENIEGEI